MCLWVDTEGEDTVVFTFSICEFSSLSLPYFSKDNPLRVLQVSRIF